MTEVRTWLSELPTVATSIFHMGRYCEQWKASTHHTGHPSFHIVLEGICWLRLEQSQTVIPLAEGDIVFLFSALPFYLQSSPDASPEKLPKKIMSPLTETRPDDTALLCGFLHPGDDKGQLFFALLPEYTILTQEMKINKKLHQLFELLKLECWNAESECAQTITRLTDILLIYVMEAVIEDHMTDINLLRIAQHERLTTLAVDILRNPSREWTTDTMAGLLHMSRSTFIRKVISVSTYNPNEMVTRLRINVAVKLLRRGFSIEDVAAKTGYESLAGFHKAFKKVTLKTPVTYVRCKK